MAFHSKLQKLPKCYHIDDAHKGKKSEKRDCHFTPMLCLGEFSQITLIEGPNVFQSSEDCRGGGGGQQTLSPNPSNNSVGESGTLSSEAEGETGTFH